MITSEMDIGKGLFSRKDHLLLACSGGPDSICLFHLLVQRGYVFSVAHVNYHLRGAESEKDQQLVEDLCKEFQIQCYVEHVKLSQVNKRSIQNEARRRRYAFFARLMRENEFTYLVTAHHQGDLVENALFRFVRGTGLRGLQSFSVIRDKMIRPLLNFSKADLVAYLDKRGLTYRQDTSNQALKYTRNKIRNAILPELEKDLPNINERIARTTKLLRADYRLIQSFIRPYKDQLIKGEVEWECQNLYLDQTAFWFHLFENITEDQCRQIAHACSQQNNGFQSKVDDYCISIIQNKVKVTPASELQNDISIEIEELNKGHFVLDAQTELRIDPQEVKVLQFSESVLFISADHLSLPLRIRHPLKGDKFQPLGMKGKKLLSDFYNDLGIPANLKSKEWVLTDKKGLIIALLPHRISERFKIQDQTRKALRLELCKTLD